MWETVKTTFLEFFTSGDVWAVIIKVLATALLTAGLGYIGTCIGRLIAKNKESKIYRYADTCVRAAEQKFPNEGKKMGPEKMAYVMDQLAIKFPKIKENTYLYNIAEAAVRELNKEMEKEATIKEFEEKYGEKPIAVMEKKIILEEDSTSKMDNVPSKIEEKPAEEQKQDPKKEIKVNSTSKGVKLSSF